MDIIYLIFGIAVIAIFLYLFYNRQKYAEILPFHRLILWLFVGITLILASFYYK